MIIENGIKHIRMGKRLDFIKGVILSDGTILQNMQCRLDAEIPTDEELEKFNQKNMKQKIDYVSEVARLTKLLKEVGAN